MVSATDKSLDESFMARAVALAAKGAGRTSPNPVVGAVIVKAGRIKAEGYHAKAGGPHAEIAALAHLKAAGQSAKGADIYVTLEPCSHYGRTPPCANALIAAGIRRVVIGMIDPNPLVAGCGMKKLRAAGIDVVSGVLADRCVALNPAFIKYITTKRPFVTLKLAASLDGKIAVSNGQSKWITGAQARKYGHRLRALSDAVMTSSATVAKDAPVLTVRDASGLNPLRVLLDTRFKTPLDAHIFGRHSKDRFSYPALVFTTASADAAKVKKAQAMGVDVVCVRKAATGVDIKMVMAELGRRGVTSLLVEGGGVLAAALLKAGTVDRLSLHLAPVIIGADGTPAIGALGLENVSKALRLKNMSVRRIGEDMIIEGDIL